MNMKYLLVLLMTVLISACDLQYSPDKEDVMNAAPLVIDTTTDNEPGVMTLRGMFRYMADAAIFRDCSTGKSFPVVMAGPYIELESAYLNSGIEPGAELMVSIHGRYMERNDMEGNSSRINLLVDSFDEIHDSSDCEPPVQTD